MLKIINGTFENGCGITIHDTEKDNYYHKVVYKNSVEINGKIYYKEDFEKRDLKSVVKIRCTCCTYNNLIKMKPTKDGFLKAICPRCEREYLRAL